MPVLDASFLIDLQRGSAGAVRILESLHREGESLFVPAQAAIEFASGLPDPQGGLHRLSAAFTVLDLDREHMVEAAELGRKTKATGRLPGWADTSIAAAARLKGTYVITANAKPFRALRVDHWDYRNDAEPTVYPE
ncbi:MAG TPA: PIN domain-containing protein [Candidatus Thermoplasmatota archaeon]|nr:PIN domain-containing protein [Candidatus Thermoplasmatota archaeon]